MYCKLLPKELISLFFLRINSSKVYCKYVKTLEVLVMLERINSSKVYCKLTFPWIQGDDRLVLIVAKCIVN